MPVVRSKSPRFEGGRCYPKFSSWGNITRGTLWEGTKRGCYPLLCHQVRPLPDGLPRDVPPPSTSQPRQGAQPPSLPRGFLRWGVVNTAANTSSRSQNLIHSRPNGLPRNTAADRRRDGQMRRTDRGATADGQGKGRDGQKRTDSQAPEDAVYIEALFRKFHRNGAANVKFGDSCGPANHVKAVDSCGLANHVKYVGSCGAPIKMKCVGSCSPADNVNTLDSCGLAHHVKYVDECDPANHVKYVDSCDPADNVKYVDSCGPANVKYVDSCGPASHVKYVDSCGQANGMWGGESCGTCEVVPENGAKNSPSARSCVQSIDRQRTFIIADFNVGLHEEITKGVPSPEINCGITNREINGGIKPLVFNSHSGITRGIENITNGDNLGIMDSNPPEVKGCNPGDIKGGNPLEIKDCNPGNIIGCNPLEIKGCNPGDIKGSNPLEITKSQQLEITSVNPLEIYGSNPSVIARGDYPEITLTNYEIARDQDHVEGLQPEINPEVILEMLKGITLSANAQEITPLPRKGITLGTLSKEITNISAGSPSKEIIRGNPKEITPLLRKGITPVLRKGITPLPRKSNLKMSLPGICWSSKRQENKKSKDLAQRGSATTTTTTTNNTQNNNNNNHFGSGKKGASNSNKRRGNSRSPKGQDDHEGGGGDGQLNNSSAHGSGKRGLKFGARNDVPKTRTPNLNTPLNRTRSGSRSSSGSSPAGLHGRALPLKTAVVAPAPSRLTPKTNALNRFGFRNSAQSKSGDSTDSVNSILSDAQTCSDSNSNIFDLCEDDNENQSANRNSDSVCDDNSFARSARLDSVDSSRVDAAPKVSIPVPKHAATPNSSSTPATTPLSNRLTAHTRQLPKPQVVTVKPVSPKVQTSLCNSPSISNVTSARTRSPSIKSLLHTPLRTAADHSPAVKPQSNATLRAPRESHDSESSTRSTTELDSGLGSSSESDRIRGGEGDGAEARDSCDAEKAADPSDAWLTKTRQQQQLAASKRKSRGSMEIQFNGTSSFEIKRQSLEGKEKTEARVSPLAARGVPSPLEKKLEAGKEKRDTTITYGMARQKFAPYSRSRYGYGYQSAQTRTGTSTPSPASAAASLASVGSPGSGITKIPGSAGLVRSRVAMIETPQQAKKTTLQQTPPVVLRRSNLKKPLVRPTSLEKTPILVMPAAEKTVELSRPVCRKLEYSENTVGTPKRNEAQRDETMWENEVTQEGKDLILRQVLQPVEDILIVGSVEVETHKDSNVMVESDHHGSFYENVYDKGLSLDRSEEVFKGGANNSLGERKAYRDPAEKEKADTREARAADAPEVIGVSEEESGRKHNVETPDDSGIKLVSPQSESSFEILESLSETVDLTAEETGKSAANPAAEGRAAESAADDDDGGETRAGSADTKATDATEDDAMLLTSPEAKIESSIDSAFSSEPATVASLDGDAESKRPPPAKASPSLVLDSPEGVPFSSVPKGQDNAAAEARKPPLSSAAIPLARLSSFDLKSAMESSVESHKSASILTDSAEHSNISGKCTPTLATSNLDQDFLIDDEIADQPGLMFGGSAMASSFFTDDGLFDDIGTSPPPCHSQLKQVIAESSRSRANSIDTASSVGGDDLMLDYFDMEEAKTGGYEEEVLSPDANEIFSEWTAMMAEVSGAVSERCVSRDGSTTSSGGGGGGAGTGSRTSRPRLSSSSELSTDSRRPTVLRPPRQGGVTEMEGGGGVGSPGGVFVDRTAYHYMCQDVTSLKTMLLRLRRVLQVAETINPFDANLRNSLYLSLAGGDSTLSSPGAVNGDKDCPSAPSVNELSQENTDLRRQVVLLQQQLQERDRTIRLLQQQLAQNIESQQQQQQQQQTQTGPPTGVPESAVGVETAASNGRVNAATQTDRSSRSTTLRGSSLSRTTSIDDGLGPTVSSEVDAAAEGRSVSASDHHHPRAASHPPGELLVQ